MSSVVIKRLSQQIYCKPVALSQKMNYNDQNMQKISQVDSLLQKNQEIYKNLKQKLDGITKADRNITNNINIIKPLSYASIQSINKLKRQARDYQRQRQNYNYNKQRQRISQRQIYLINNSKKSLGEYDYQTQQSNASSPIKGQKNISDSLVKRQINITSPPSNTFIRQSTSQEQHQRNSSRQLIRLSEAQSTFRENNYNDIQQQSSFNGSYYQKLNQRSFLKQSSKYSKKNKGQYFIDNNNFFKSIYQNISIQQGNYLPQSMKKSNNNDYYYPRISSKNIITSQKNNLPPIQQAITKQYQKQLENLERLEKSERQYLMAHNYQLTYLETLDKIHLNQLNKKKNKIQKIYQELKQEQDKIQRQYQQYKKSLGYDSNISDQGNNFKSNKFRTQQAGKNNISQLLQHKKTSSISSPEKKKKNSPKKSPSSSPTKKQQSASKLNKSISKSKKQLSLSPPALLKKQKTQKISQSPLHMSTINKNIQQFSHVIDQKQSQNKNKTNNFDNILLNNNKDDRNSMMLQQQKMRQLYPRNKAKSHIYIPFNKLYKSPILQMKSSNTLILARPSKISNIKTNQSKIIDGKKYKFSSNIQTDQQSLIKNILSKQTGINNLAIVGGQQTLKKKLHMAFIAHAFDKIMSIIDKKQYNFMYLNISYTQLIDKPNSQQVRIQNSVELDTQQTSSLKLGLMKIQKTIEQVYYAMKKQGQSNNFNLTNKLSSNSSNLSNLLKYKLIRQTKLTLSSGKKIIYDCHVLSMNQYNYQLLKTISANDIVWSVNPLVKYNDDVVKIIAEIGKYEDAK